MTKDSYKATTGAASPVLVSLSPLFGSYSPGSLYPPQLSSQLPSYVSYSSRILDSSEHSAVPGASPGPLAISHQTVAASTMWRSHPGPYLLFQERTCDSVMLCLVSVLSQVLQNTAVSAKWPTVPFLMNTAKADRTGGRSVELHIVAHIPASALVRWLPD